ncbi:hypothetical protein K0651_02285 [Ornithinimicrobium sp. Arc0846-15]|nr:hypothetical protein [Ornithinimicrobium laminariae]
MKPTRSLVALCLSSALMLSACSGGDDTDADQATSTGDAGAATTDAAAATASPDEASATAEPTEESTQGVLSIGEAETIANDVLTAAAKSTQSDGESAASDMEAGFAGPALEAAKAADKLEKVEGEPASIDLIANPIDANVLAISRDDGETPAIILAQTVPGSGIPELHLLVSQDGNEDFKVVWTAPQLPGTEVGSFDRRTAGTPVVRSGGGDFSTTPGTALNELADYVDYPINPIAEVRTNGFAPEVRANALTQAKDVEVQADFVERNEVIPGNTVTLYLEDGSGVTFAVLDRESTFTVKEGMELTPPETFTTFVDDESLTESATLEAYVFVAMTIPVEEGKPSLIAAGEQIIGASGE